MLSELAYDQFGESNTGIPLVLVHGFPLDRTIFAPVAPRLASSGLRVLTVDLPGFGGSAFPGDFSLEDLARRLRGFLTQQGLTPFFLGGLSMGGYVALQYHRLFPADLTGLVLIDTKSSDDTAEAKENRNRMAEVARREGSKPVARMMFTKMLGETTRKSPGGPAIEQRLMDIMEHCPAGTIASACIAMRDRADFTPDLHRSDVPLLMLTGAEDVIAPPAVGREVASAARRGTFVEIPGAGHIATMEQPERVAAAITAWRRSL